MSIIDLKNKFRIELFDIRVIPEGFSSLMRFDWLCETRTKKQRTEKCTFMRWAIIDFLPGDSGVPPTPVVHGIQPRPFFRSALEIRRRIKEIDVLAIPPAASVLELPSGVILRAITVKIIFACFLDGTCNALHLANPQPADNFCATFVCFSVSSLSLN